MTEFEEAMMIRAAVQGDENARRWLADLHERTGGRDGLPANAEPEPEAGADYTPHHLR